MTRTSRAISYSAEELSWIEAHSTMPRREAYDAFLAKFGREDISFNNFTALCKRNGWKTGRTGHFPSGHAPANKGKKMPYNPNSARTQFKKGHQPHNTKFAGHERLHEDGYIYISIDEKNPHTGYERRYVLKHKYLWEKENGPVPEGMCLKCLDGDRQNTNPANWELIPRAALVLINHRTRTIDYEEAAPEVKPAILTLAKLKHTKFSKSKATKKGKASKEKV